MNAIQPQDAPLALEPMDESSADGRGIPPPGQGDLRMTTADEFLAAATKEYEEGHIDETLWARASAQSGVDESLVIAAYLRARATTLRIEKRDRRRARRERRAKAREQAREEARKRNAEAESRTKNQPAAAAGVGLRGLPTKPRYFAAATAAVVAVVAAASFIASQSVSDSTAPPSRASAAGPPTGRTSPAAAVAGGQAVAGNPSGSADERNGSGPSIDATVAQLKETGNWNMLVLHAAKWTRDQPDNATAWKELSIGYANLHQYDDAVVAAAKAAELSPGDALLWRNLGHLNVTLNRLAEAESAFDKALAARPDDADALCGAALAAYKLGRKQDADAIAKRVDSADGRCPEMSDGETVAVVVHAPVAPSKPMPKVRR
jgi:tetratricopeptide (TPR) repeat protein